MNQGTLFEVLPVEQKQEPTPTAPVSLSGCTLIYEPKGKAREYAALACNVYKGCSHGCVYCYAPSAIQVQRDLFVQAKPRAADFLVKLEKEAVKYQAAGTKSQVLLCFTTDPYQPLDEQLGTTRKVLETLKAHGLHFITLTKGGHRALRDLDLFTAKDAFATTLTFASDDSAWKDWEPNATPPFDRIATIKTFHNAGIPTWVSLEPVLSPSDSLEIIRQTCGFVDLFKVGRLNYHPHAQTIDWQRFGYEAINLLESLGYRRNFNPDAVHTARPDSRQFYVKRDLANEL